MLHAQPLPATFSVRSAALQVKPKTENEIILLSALREADTYCQHADQHTFELQASNILLDAHITRLKLQLATLESTKKDKNMGDGLTLTGDEKEARVEAQGKARRDAATKLFKVAKLKWAVADKARKEGAAEARAKNAQAKEAYERKKAKAKAEGRVFRGAAPTMLPIPKKIPEPRLRNFLAGITGEGHHVSAGEDGELSEGFEGRNDEHNATDDDQSS